MRLGRVFIFKKKLNIKHAISSVGKGEILTEIDPASNEVTQIVNGWSKVKNQRGSIGFVPTPLLKQLEHSN